MLPFYGLHKSASLSALHAEGLELGLRDQRDSILLRSGAHGVRFPCAFISFYPSSILHQGHRTSNGHFLTGNIRHAPYGLRSAHPYCYTYPIPFLLLIAVPLLLYALLLVAVPLMIGVPLSILWAPLACIVLVFTYLIRPYALELRRNVIDSFSQP